LIPGRKDIIVRDERARMLRDRVKMREVDLWPVVQKAYRSDLVQVTLEREAETVKVQIIEIVVERILTAIAVNIGKGG
jgi:hypothetical protein